MTATNARSGPVVESVSVEAGSHGTRSARGSTAELAVGLARALAVVQPRLALRPEEAAEALGVSREFFDVHVKSELRLVRRGRLVLVPVAELERWLLESAERTVP
jgi:excisionase family DNA binding protein